MTGAWLFIPCFCCFGYSFEIFEAMDRQFPLAPFGVPGRKTLIDCLAFLFLLPNAVLLLLNAICKEKNP
jgi:hypothetical protein